MEQRNWTVLEKHLSFNTNFFSYSEMYVKRHDYRSYDTQNFEEEDYWKECLYIFLTHMLVNIRGEAIPFSHSIPCHFIQFHSIELKGTSLFYPIGSPLVNIWSNNIYEKEWVGWENIRTIPIPRGNGLHYYGHN